MRLSFKRKITLSLWLVAIVSTLSAGALTTYLIFRTQENAVDDKLKATASTLMSLGISDYSGLATFEELDKYIGEATKTGKLSHTIMVFNKKGKLLYSNIPESGGERDTMAQNFMPTIAPMTLMREVGGRTLKVLMTPYEAKSGKDYYMLVAVPYPVYLDTLKEVSREGLVLFGFLSLLAFLLSQWLARVLIAPVKEIATYLNQVAPHDIRDLKPLVLSKPDEHLTDIVLGINTLAQKIKSTLYTMNRTSKFLAHELRNPLTILSGEAETILANSNASKNDYRSVIESSVEEIGRMNNVVDTVMKVFGKDKAIYHPVPTNIAAWLDDNISKWQKYLQRELSWQKPEGDFTVLVDKDLLYRLIDNLIRNIKKHAGISAKARILLGHNADGDLMIEVADSGFGMPPDLLKALSERNVTAEKVGIGLSLCMEIAAICNFTLTFANQETGGLSVSIVVS